MMLKINGVTSVLVKITLLIGVMYLIWHALYLRVVADENPSALDSKELQEIVRREATIDSNLPAMNSQCLRVELTGPSPEIMGIDGIAFKKIPGQYDITLLLKTEFEKQPKRDRQLWQLDYLAEQGIFDAYNGTVESTNGERAVRRYRLTWPGAVIMGRRGGSTTVCLEYGRVTYGEIKNIEKLQEKHKTGDIYKVTYTLKLVDIPGWAKNEKALKLFDRLAEALKDKVRVTKVLKTNDGWQLLKERQPARAVSGFGHITIPIDIKSIDKEIEVPSVEAINAYIDENARSIDWLVKYEKTCMPVWIHVGDDKSTQTDKEFSVTYYDLKDRKQYEFQKIVNSLHLLTALERAGLAELEYISQQANSSISTHEPGVRFRVKRQAIEAIDLHKQGKGCIPYGRQSVEILSVKADKGMNRMGYHFTAKKIVEEVPVWVKKIAKELPALESVIEHGVLMRGYLFNNSYNKKYWEIQNADYIYPRINHNSLPSYLEPVLRNTALAMPAKKVIAPIVPANDSGSEYEPPNSSVINKPVKKSKIKSMGSQFQVKQIQDNASLENSSVSKTSLYSVGDSDVHVIAIYEGSGRHGGPRKWAEDVVGQVSLTVRVIDSVLLLYAYKPTSWNLKVYDGYAIKKVIVAGSKNQQVNVSGQVKPKVIAIDNRKLMSSIDVGRYSRFPTGHSKNELLDAALITSAVTGKAPTTYQAFYKAPKGGFYISDSTPVFRPPLPIKPSDYPKNTKISMQSGQLLYWSDREFSSGKLYTEMRLRVINALYAPKRSNLGLCLSKTKGVVGSDKGSAKLMIQGEQSLRKDGDVFGIAADFDNQRIYYHVNGNWVTGKPGSGDGVKLEKDKFYRICATSSFRAIKEFRSSIDLVINSSIKQYTKMSIQGM